MLQFSFHNQEFWMFPLIAISGLCLGWMLEKLILHRVLATFGTKGWQGEVFIRKALNGFFTFGLFIAGIYVAVHYSLEDENLTARINLIAKVLFISFLAIYTSRSIGAIIQYYTGQEGAGLPNSSILVNLARLIIILIGFVIILNSIGISITPILTALGVGGLAVALALQDTLGNLFAGLQILAARKISVGHYIKLDSGDEGQIEDIAWRNTTIRTLRNNVVVIPNSKVANAILTNFSAPTEDFSVAVEGSVSYDSDLEKVEQIVLDEAIKIMQAGEWAFPDFEPSMTYMGFQDSGISFRVLLRTRDFTQQFSLRHHFMKRLHARFKQEGIEIPYPKRDVYFRTPLQSRD